MTELWVYLAQTPLLWLVLTLTIYQLADWLFKRTGSFPLLNPVLVSVILLVVLLLATNTAYQTYFNGAQFLHFFLGPATVALAIPLYAYINKLRRLFLPLMGALVLGSIIAIVSAVAIGSALGLSEITLRSMMAKSVTTPIAMGIAEQVGGLPSLTAVIVILTGIIGAVTSQGVLNLARIKEYSIRGFATGLAAHGIGTARAFEESEESGAFSGLAMGLNGIVTSFLVPFLASFIL